MVSPARRHELIRSLSRGGPLGTARRLQQLQRQQMLRGRARSRTGEPRPVEQATVARCTGGELRIRTRGPGAWIDGASLPLPRSNEQEPREAER